MLKSISYFLLSYPITEANNPRSPFNRLQLLFHRSPPLDRFAPSQHLSFIYVSWTTCRLSLLPHVPTISLFVLWLMYYMRSQNTRIEALSQPSTYTSTIHYAVTFDQYIGLNKIWRRHLRAVVNLQTACDNLLGRKILANVPKLYT